MRIYFKPLLFVLFLSATAGCEKHTPQPAAGVETGKLKLVANYHLDVKEPSGLTFNADKSALFTVSDNTNNVFEMDLEGNIIKKLPFKGDDLEGICFNRKTGELAIVEERKREVVILNGDGNEKQRFVIDIPANVQNKGLEGIAYNSNNSSYYIVNEANPGLLCVWNPERGILEETGLKFATDYSGIYVDAGISTVWVVSDESKTLYKCNYKMEPVKQYMLDDYKYEGVAVDDDNNLVYLVNDASSQLVIYKLEN